MNEEVYDPLSQAQKHVMLRNGTFEFDRVKQGICCCNHSVNDHLDLTDCCLSKELPLCLCDRFKDKEAKLTKRDKLPRKEDVLQEKARQLDIYIQTLTRV